MFVDLPRSSLDHEVVAQRFAMAAVEEPQERPIVVQPRAGSVLVAGDELLERVESWGRHHRWHVTQGGSLSSASRTLPRISTNGRFRRLLAARLIVCSCLATISSL